MYNTEFGICFGINYIKIKLRSSNQRIKLIMDNQSIISIFKYLPSSEYLNFIQVSKAVTTAVESCAYLKLSPSNGIHLSKVHSLELEGRVDNDSLPQSTQGLVLNGSYKSSTVVKLLQKYTLESLVLSGIECNTMGEFKHIHQLLGTQTKLHHLQYMVAPTDPSLIHLTSLQGLTSLRVRLIPRLIPVITQFKGLKRLSISFGAQSIAKVTEDNNGINPFKSLGSLSELTSLKVSADAIKQLNSLSELTSIKTLRVLDLLELNVSGANRLTFLTKIRPLKTVFVRVKTPLKTPTELANYLKLPQIFVVSISAFNHDFEKEKSFDAIEKLPKHCRGEIESAVFWRNTSQLDKAFGCLGRMCSFRDISVTSCPNFSTAALDAIDLPMLQGLTLSQCLKVKTLDFLSNCRVLSSLVLEKIPIPDSNALSALRTLPLMQLGVGVLKEFDVATLGGCNNLKSLVLRNIGTLKGVGQLSPSVESLTVEGCADFCTCDIPKDHKLTRLRLVEVSTANTLVFVSQLKHLTQLELQAMKECAFGTNEIFGLTGCSSLRSLVIKDVPEFTQDVQSTIIVEMPKLQIQ